MLLKTEKDVNASLEDFASHEISKGEKKFRQLYPLSRTTHLRSRKPMIDSRRSRPHCDFFRECSGSRSGEEKFTVEVSVNGPRSTHRHLADHTRQRAPVLSEKQLVAPYGCVRCGSGNRPSFHSDIHFDGNGVRGRPADSGVFCMEIPRARFRFESALHARQ